MGAVTTGARRVEPLGDDRVAVRHGAAVEIVRARDLLFIRAMRNACRITTVNGEVPVNAPLHEVVVAFSDLRLLRIHRGAAVNLARARRLVGRGGHRVSVVLDTGHELMVGRDFQPLVRRFFAGLRPLVTGT